MQVVSRMKSDSVSSVQKGLAGQSLPVLTGKRGYGNPSCVCEYTDISLEQVWIQTEFNNDRSQSS